jgi:hypothetical protein
VLVNQSVVKVLADGGLIESSEVGHVDAILPQVRRNQVSSNRLPSART